LQSRISKRFSGSGLIKRRTDRLVCQSRYLSTHQTKVGKGAGRREIELVRECARERHEPVDLIGPATAYPKIITLAALLHAD